MSPSWLTLVIAVIAACSNRGQGGKLEGSGHAEGSGRVAIASDATSTGKDTTMSTIDRLQAWGGPDLGVNPYHDVKVAGVELYYLANTVQYRGVAVVDGAADPLTGKAGLRACIDRGVTDPAQLASLALHFLERGGKPIRDAAEVSSQPAAVVNLVRPPTVHGAVLEFWAWDTAHELVSRYRVDLGTLELQREDGQALVRSQRDPIQLALEQLASTSQALHRGGIDLLVSACKDPRAAKALNDVIVSHGDPEARSWAAFQSATCHDTRTAASLIAALEKDAHAPVRKQAADALGKLGAKEARAALQKAQQDPDADVSGAAGRALKKLP